MDKIEKFRQKIDNIDSKISKLLKTRLKLTISIGKIKKSKRIPIKDKKREEEILKKLKTDYEKEIFKKIIKESRKNQSKTV